MPKTHLTNYQYLIAKLSTITDDPDKYWHEYPCLIWDRAIRQGSGFVTFGGRTGTIISTHRAAFACVFGDPGECPRFTTIARIPPASGQVISSQDHAI